MRILLSLPALFVLSVALAQQPVTSPVYYLSTAPRLEVGTPVAGELDEHSGRNFKDGTYLDALVMHGEAGEYVELYASSVVFDTYLTLYAPDGSLLEFNDDDPLGVGTDAAIRTTLPTTGRYLVVVSGFGPWDLGPYTIERVSAAAASVTEIAIPSHTYATLEPDVSAARFRFVLDDVSAIQLDARSAAFDTTLELFDEFGYSLAYNDDAPVTDEDDYTTDSALALMLTPGTYDVLVQPFFADDVGDGTFEFEVRRLVPVR